ncbi:SMI1/KNR4 family protein [Pseudoflavitalea sp. G-6-1-2]|uniref:SMI1/KNR4 family protein n=1 Tax=Pseudoflavitalea sp. G-6-1-2 TaxID=2728841 RepID=UPI00146F64A0|nr:SMI1/KNR4 family protein [Pseudoflavitalea sp. G-6-1-2]NML21908.1 SMI1/KNR4 family protein [Pseudoflavitalea sp. G-6-1-2]
MNPGLETLLQIFKSGSLIRSEKQTENRTYRFEGIPEQHAEGAESLQAKLGYSIDKNILDFISIFGGTKLFINDFGNSINIYPFDAILTENLRIAEELGSSHFPVLVMIGEDTVGDYLCLYKDVKNVVHFGNMHHEVMGASPEDWMTGFTCAHFPSWLSMFVEQHGNTLPDKTCSYTIFETIEYIYAPQASRYLKAGKPLALFLAMNVQDGKYIYEWLRFEKQDAQISATWIHSIYPGEHSNDVEYFETFNSNYSEAEKSASKFTGSFEACLNWAKLQPAYHAAAFLRLADLPVHFSGILSLIQKKHQ